MHATHFTFRSLHSFSSHLSSFVFVLVVLGLLRLDSALFRSHVLLILTGSMALLHGQHIRLDSIRVAHRYALLPFLTATTRQTFTKSLF